MNTKQAVADLTQQALSNPKVALGVSGGTVATGGATWFDWLPGEIGFYASAIGIIVSLIVCYTTVRGGMTRRKLDKCSLELVNLEKKKLLKELREKKGDV